MLRKAYFYLILLGALHLSPGALAIAEALDFAPQSTEQQKALATHFKAQDHLAALSQFDQAFGQSRFARSVDGQAFKAYLMYRSGLKITGIESLNRISQPQQMHPTLKKLWLENLKVDDPVLKHLNLSWSPRFRGIIPTEVLQAQEQRDQWNRLLLAAANDRPQSSLRDLNRLRRSSQKIFDADLLNLTEARILFQMNRLNETPSLYRSIPKSSDLWLEAREELAWTYLRLDQPEKALAEMKSLVTVFFRHALGPEPFVLLNLAHLSVCDYPAIFRASTEFKRRFGPRVQALAQLESSERLALIQSALNQMAQGKSREKMGELAALMPRRMFTDTHILHLTGLTAQLTRESQLLARLQMNPLNQGLEGRIRRAQEQALNQVRQLAQKELIEIRNMTQRLHLVEAEVIQRMHIESRKANNSSRLRSSGSPHRGEVLSFPASREVWRDEIGNFVVDVRECPRLEMSLSQRAQ